MRNRGCKGCKGFKGSKGSKGLLRLTLMTFTTFTTSALELSAQQPDLKSPLPFDSSVITGRLENGLRYYIRVNHRPEKRAELRLAVNAGSVLEEDNHGGSALLAEH